VGSIPKIFAKGEFMGRELSDHDRADKSIIAFHPYRKWIELKNGYKVFAEVQACERENESDLFYAGYNLKALKKVASPSRFDSVADNTKWLSLGFMATYENSNPQFDKAQDNVTTNNELPLLLLIIKDETFLSHACGGKHCKMYGKQNEVFLSHACGGKQQ
jgi:hypothetical protein